MAGVGFVEDMLREQSLLEATCGDLFDHIDDLLDFPKEESAADVLLLDAPAPGSPLSSRIIGGHATMAAAPPPPPQMMALPPPPAPAKDDASALFDAAGALGAEVFDRKDAHIGPCDELDMDMAQLEWLSGLFDDGTIPHEPSFPGVNCAAPIKASALTASAGVVLPDKAEEALFRSSSPISVLEHSGFNVAANGGSSSSSSSSASSSSESFSGSGRAWSAPVSPRPEPPVLVIPARARSKRSRPSAFPAVRGAPAATETTILVPTPMYSSTSSHSDPESIAESNPHPPPMKKKKKAKKPAAPAAASDAEADADAADADYEEGGALALPPGTVRRCTHCQIEKTPQWRAGPLGPKTLCNACGVRYKSGRLLPEYRPACSPTFVSAIHSNSHRKVLEMRRKKEVGSGLLTAAAAAAPAVASF